MKILVVGDGHSAIHEVAVAAAFKKLGHEVESFYWQDYFKSRNPIRRLWLRAQNKFLMGPTFNKLNRDLIRKAIQFKPKLIFFYRGTHIVSTSIVALKRALPHCKIFGYNNDDPFAAGHPFWLWRHFLKSVPVYDLVFAYRHHNLDEFMKLGAKRVELLRSWFVPELNHFVSISDEDKLKYKCDVVFIGHYENDGRFELLEAIVKAGYVLRLFGPPYEWNKLLLKSEILKYLSPVHLVWNEDYNKAISGAKVALCFFSKLNRDTYTRRCFEIPATGTLLLSEYSDDMATIYRAGIEADYFSSKEELTEKVKLYIENDSFRSQVAACGNRRVVEDGHDIVSRMSKVVTFAGDSD